MIDFKELEMEECLDICSYHLDDEEDSIFIMQNERYNIYKCKKCNEYFEIPRSCTEN